MTHTHAQATRGMHGPGLNPDPPAPQQSQTAGAFNQSKISVFKSECEH